MSFVPRKKMEPQSLLFDLPGCFPIFCRQRGMLLRQQQREQTSVRIGQEGLVSLLQEFRRWRPMMKTELPAQKPDHWSIGTDDPDLSPDTGE
jgi:hypothetical protein